MSRRTSHLQKGNPHKITHKQHIFPAASIERFTDAKGNVCVSRLPYRSSPSFKVKSDNTIFCVRSAWHHGAETGFMKACEDQFQTLISELIESGRYLQEPDMKAITRFYFLWQCRAEYGGRYKADETEPLMGLTIPDGYTKDIQERLEKAMGIVPSCEGEMPKRMIVGPLIQIELNRCMKKYHKTRWGIVWSDEAEFVVPDRDKKGLFALPVTPNMLLVANCPSQKVDYQTVASLNASLIDSATKYWFARDPSHCPILKQPLAFYRA